MLPQLLTLRARHFSAPAQTETALAAVGQIDQRSAARLSTDRGNQRDLDGESLNFSEALSDLYGWQALPR